MFDYGRDGRSATSGPDALRYAVPIGEERTFGVELDGDGLYVGSGAGRFKDSMRVRRVDATGKLVATWGNSGFLALPALRIFEGLYLQPDGGLFVAGRTVSSVNQTVLQRITPAGQVDQAFGTNGEYRSPNGSIVGTLGAANGGVYLVSLGASAGSAALLVSRLLPSGKLDETFGQNGLATYVLRGDGFAKAEIHLGADARGGLLINGETTQEGFVAVLDGDGRPAPGFENGPARIPFFTRNSAASTVSQWLVQPDGKLLLSARTFNNSNWYVFRFLPNGELDPTWGPNGIGWSTDFIVQVGDRMLIEASFNLVGNLMTQTPDGNLVYAGTSSGAVLAVRLRSDSKALVGVRDVLPKGHEPGLSIRYGNDGARRLAIENPLQGQHKVMVYAMSGQLLWETSWAPSAGGTLELPAGLLSGTYAVAVLQPDASRRAVLGHW